jgi:hypothetical protein
LGSLALTLAIFEFPHSEAARVFAMLDEEAIEVCASLESEPHSGKIRVLLRDDRLFGRAGGAAPFVAATIAEVERAGQRCYRLIGFKTLDLPASPRSVLRQADR